MKLRKANHQEVVDAEKIIDAEFLKLPLPAKNQLASRWHLLVAFEDRLRNALWQLTRDPRQENWNQEMYGFIMLLDRLKYALRYALDRIYSEQPTNAIAGELCIVPSAYLAAAEFFKSGENYLLACRAFSSYHCGNAMAHCSSSKRMLVFSLPDEDLPYSALNVYLSDEDSGTPLIALVRAFVAPEQPALLVDKLAQRIKVIGSRVSYIFDPFLCNQLRLAIPNPASIVPDGWVFPWANSQNSHRVFEALQVRSLFHILSVHFSALRSGLAGCGLDDICLRISTRQLVNELREISGVDQEECRSIVEALTYGAGTETPDPALQPLMPFPDSTVILPAIQILSSNFPRNFLSLHSRVGSASFDAQSEKFETRMSKKVEAAVKVRFPLFRMNSHLPGKPEAGEVDLTIVDEISATILLGELRWMLPPGDPREVNNRKKVCGEKVGQLEKKLNAARQVTTQILNEFGVETESESWTVVGVVIVDGYAAPGPKPQNIPIVPIEIFEIGLNLMSELRDFHGWSASGVWLPQRGRHYTSSDVTAKFGQQRLRWGGFHIEVESRYLAAHVPQSASDFANW